MFRRSQVGGHSGGPERTRRVYRGILHLPLAIVAFSLAGCATQLGAVANPSTPKATYQSAYLVVHGDRSADMDAKLQRELLRHGLAVTIGPENAPTGDAQLLVKYTDNWRWDIAMYLRTLDVMVYDAHSKALVATGSWRNSALHGFYSADKVVADVVDQTVGKLAK